MEHTYGTCECGTPLDSTRIYCGRDSYGEACVYTAIRAEQAEALLAEAREAMA